MSRTRFLLLSLIFFYTTTTFAQTCRDDKDWRDKKTRDDCDDVAKKNTKSRCNNYKDRKGNRARDACCETCSEYQKVKKTSNPTQSPTYGVIDYASFALPGDNSSVYNHDFPLPGGVKNKNGGYNPINQRNWEDLNQRGIEFQVFDWEEESKVEIRGNQCEDRNLADDSKGARHKQSPIVLRDEGNFCEDEHEMHGNTNPGHNCSTNQLEFLTTKHNLRADFANCRQTPFIDLTQSRFLWDLEFIEVVCPSNHVIEDPITKELKRYPCELVLGHSGTDQDNKEIMQISVLLEGVPDKIKKRIKGGKDRVIKKKRNKELEQLLNGWEAHQKSQFDKCYMYWEGDDICAIKSAPRYEWPSASPSTTPTVSSNPSSSPSASPTDSPTISARPSSSPSSSPTDSPSASPTSSPTYSPSVSPSTTPTSSPSMSPSTSDNFFTITYDDFDDPLRLTNFPRTNKITRQSKNKSNYSEIRLSESRSISQTLSHDVSLYRQIKIEFDIGASTCEDATSLTWNNVQIEGEDSRRSCEDVKTNPEVYCYEYRNRIGVRAYDACECTCAKYHPDYVPIEESCKDDKDWKRSGESKYCKDVKDKPEYRCSKWKNSEGVLAMEACCEACSEYNDDHAPAEVEEAKENNCKDDKDWKQTGRSKYCDDVKDDPKDSCKTWKNSKGVFAMEACCETCSEYNGKYVPVEVEEVEEVKEKTCKDDKDWKQTGRSKYCEDVKDDPKASCRNWKNSEGVLAMEACCETCSEYNGNYVPLEVEEVKETTCKDDEDWKQTGRSRYCKDVKDDPKASCKKWKNSKGVLAMEACCETCSEYNGGNVRTRVRKVEEVKKVEVRKVVEVCKDDKDWKQKGRSKYCEDVKDDPEDRCSDWKSSKGVLAMEACCETCSEYNGNYVPVEVEEVKEKTCKDDEDWKQSGESKYCKDVKDKPKYRCSEWKSSKGVLAMDACCETCSDYKGKKQEKENSFEVELSPNNGKDYITLFSYSGEQLSSINSMKPEEIVVTMAQYPELFTSNMKLRFSRFDKKNDDDSDDDSLIRIDNIRLSGRLATPTISPTALPSFIPTISVLPSVLPTGTPSSSPTETPTYTPSASPSASPTARPSASPSHSPTSSPTSSPSYSPTISTLPTASLSPTECQNDETWYRYRSSREEITSRTCKDVEDDPVRLCNFWKNINGTLASEACCVCFMPTPDPTTEPTKSPTSCRDSSSWKIKNSNRSCRWIAEKPSQRCTKNSSKSRSGVKAYEACKCACKDHKPKRNLQQETTKELERRRQLQMATVPPTTLGKFLAKTHNWNDDTNGFEYEEENQIKSYELFKDVDTDFYYRYQGSQAYPPCNENVEWIVMREPLKVPNSQIHRLEALIAKHIEINPNSINQNGDYDECYFATVGRERNDGTCKVDVNRELQYTSADHHLVDCTVWNIPPTEKPTPAPVPKPAKNNWSWHDWWN